MSNFSSSTSYSSYSSSSSNGQTTGSAQHQSSHTDPSGTTVRSVTQNLGEPMVEETRQYDASGRELPSTGGDQARIEDVTEEGENDRKYREAMELEYEKREGGA